MSSFKLIKWNSTINAVIFLLIGILLLLFPDESLDIGGYLIASILMLGGLSHLIRIIKNKGIETNGDVIYLLLSVAFISLSISMFIDPTWIIRTINIVVGIILIISSLMNLTSLLKYTKDRSTSWWIYLVFTLLILILGIIVIINPKFLSEIIIRLEGAFLILDTLITILLTKRISKTLQIKE